MAKEPHALDVAESIRAIVRKEIATTGATRLKWIVDDDVSSEPHEQSVPLPAKPLLPVKSVPPNEDSVSPQDDALRVAKEHLKETKRGNKIESIGIFIGALAVIVGIIIPITIALFSSKLFRAMLLLLTQWFIAWLNVQ
jgi:hypothetical protein